MATIKYLKNLLPYQVTLHTGHLVEATVTFQPYETKIYSDYVDDNVNSTNYNKFLFEDYFTDKILAIITVNR
jgi:hypothetical protein